MTEDLIEIEDEVVREGRDQGQDHTRREEDMIPEAMIEEGAEVVAEGDIEEADHEDRSINL
jgi:hypothetical protein